MGFRDLLAALRGKARATPRLEIMNGAPAAHDPDAQVLEALRVAGANLAKPTRTLFYLYAPTEEAVRRIAASAADTVLTPEVRPAASGDGWLCLLQGQMVPAHEDLKSYRAKFESLTLKEGGEYDGWEAAVVK